MSKTTAKSEATYARELIRQLLAATDPNEKQEIANELVACVAQIACELDTPGFNTHYDN